MIDEVYVGEIRPFAFAFPPQGWALCDGSILNISQNQALYAVIGNRYGGDGVKTFALPDLRGRVPVHVGNEVKLAVAGGEETHVLTVGEMPPHTHMASALSSMGTVGNAQGNLWAKTNVQAFAGTPNATMRQDALSTAGGSQPHNNMQPYQVLNYCIALVGLFPTQN